MTNEEEAQGYDIDILTVYSRLKHGWDPYRAIFNDRQKIVAKDDVITSEYKKYFMERWLRFYRKQKPAPPKLEPEYIWYHATSHSGYYVKNPRYKYGRKRIS